MIVLLMSAKVIPNVLAFSRSMTRTTGAASGSPSVRTLLTIPL